MFKLIIFFLCLGWLVWPGEILAIRTIDISLNKVTIEVAEEVLFTLNSESDFFQPEQIIFWDFGDGTEAEGLEVKHTYESAGEYLVNALIADNQNESLYQSLVMVVTNINDNQSANHQEYIIINELLPNPVGSDGLNEFIELKNIGTGIVNLNNWWLEDESGRQYKFTDQEEILLPAGQFLLLARSETKITLNNDGDSIKLYNANGSVVDSTYYEATVPEGKSWSRQPDNSWIWIEPTPLGNNIIKSEVAVVPEIIIEELDNDKKSEELEIDSEIETNVEREVRVELNEIFPNPSGDDRRYEFVEIKNWDEYSVNLKNWSLADLTREYIFSQDTIIKAGGILLIPYSESKIVLNNTGDTITLKNPRGEAIDEVVFNRAQEDESWARTIDRGWAWTEQVSPGEENIIISEILAEETESEGVFISSLLEVGNLAKAEEVRAQGIVTVEPGIFGRQYFYMQDAISGTQVYMYQADWPELSAGDLIEINGVVSETFGESRINLKTRDNIVIIDQGQPVAAKDIQTDGFGNDLVGTLVKVEGVLLDKNSSKWLLDVGGEEISVMIKNIKDTLPDSTEGDILEVIGILRSRNNVLAIYPRTSSDLSLSTQSIQEDKVINNLEIAPDSKERNWKIYYFIITIVIFGLLFKIYWLKKQAIDY